MSTFGNVRLRSEVVGGDISFMTCVLLRPRVVHLCLRAFMHNVIGRGKNSLCGTKKREIHLSLGSREVEIAPSGSGEVETRP